MRTAWRWALVVVGAAALVAAPTAVAHLPTTASDASAADLLAAVQSSTNTPYSGYAQSTGGVLLPVTDQLGSLADLLGGTTTVRAWYRAADDWRVDTVALTGERDLHRTQAGLWSWDYEADRAILVPVPEPTLRLPREADLLPTALGQRLLSEATATEVTRLPVERVAGVDAPGLRLVPDEPQSTISAVDVWVDPGTGLPLRVQVLGRGAGRPVVSTSFLDFSPDVPDATTTTFSPPPGADVEQQGPTDLGSFADRLDAGAPPVSVAGLPLRSRDATSVTAGIGADDQGGAVGVYGSGVTALVLAPLPRRATGSLRDQLGAAPGAVTDSLGTALTVGPLSLRLTNPGSDGRVYLLTGTVTPETLTTAAQDVERGAAG